MYSDLHCPYAYLAAYRLRSVLPEFRDRLVVEHKSLAIEYVDSKPTPKGILDQETGHILLEEPDIPYQPWRAAESEWPVTMWPAFEAVKCAGRQGWEPAHELDWRLREAFFGHSRCISMRHVILDVAKSVPGLDPARLAEDFDSGIKKRLVLDEAREGWEKLDLEVSPTFVLPSGKKVANPAAPHVSLDEERNLRVASVERGPSPAEARETYRRMLQEAAARG